MVFPAKRFAAYWAGLAHGKNDIADPAWLYAGGITVESALAATVAATLLAADRWPARRFFHRQQAGGAIGLPRYRKEIHKLRKRVGKRLSHEIVHTLHSYDLSVTAILESIVGREIDAG